MKAEITTSSVLTWVKLSFRRHVSKTFISNFILNILKSLFSFITLHLALHSSSYQFNKKLIRNEKLTLD